ncbi:MAG: SpoIIE family protein phosphatase [Actinomycetota bacterium]|nr:SpoIIE family protein phosphatase [Actinomycetota bacterium]
MPFASDAEQIRVLAAALEQSTTATCITRASLDQPGPEIVYVNQAYLDLMGGSRDEVLGRSPRIMQGPHTERAVLDRLRADLGAGRTFEGETVNYRLDGSPFLIRWRIDPVRDEAGEIIFFVSSQRDVTVERRHERRLRSVEMVDAALRSVMLHPAEAGVDLDHFSAEVVDAADEIVAGFGSVQVTVAPDVHEPLDGATAGDAPTGGDHDGLRRSWDLSSATGSFAGALTVTFDDDVSRRFVDLVGLSQLAERVSSALDALFEYERRRQLAIELQESLLPDRRFTRPGFEIAARYVPGATGTQIGGDWYDVIAGEEHTTFVIGDVVGQGVGAAATMGRIRTATEVLLQRGHHLAAVAALVDRYCVEEGLMATMLLARHVGEELHVVSAGHLPPVMVSPPDVSLLDVVPGPPLGAGAMAPFELVSLPFALGDVLVMFTDGLAETPGEPIDVGLDYVRDTAVCASADPESMADKLIANRRDPTRRDDLAVLVCRRTT